MQASDQRPALERRTARAGLSTRVAQARTPQARPGRARPAGARAQLPPSAPPARRVSLGISSFSARAMASQLCSRRQPTPSRASRRARRRRRSAAAPGWDGRVWAPHVGARAVAMRPRVRAPRRPLSAGRRPARRCPRQPPPAPPRSGAIARRAPRLQLRPPVRSAPILSARASSGAARAAASRTQRVATPAWLATAAQARAGRAAARAVTSGRRAAWWATARAKSRSRCRATAVPRAPHLAPRGWAALVRRCWAAPLRRQWVAWVCQSSKDTTSRRIRRPRRC